MLARSKAPSCEHQGGGVELSWSTGVIFVGSGHGSEWSVWLESWLFLLRQTAETSMPGCEGPGFAKLLLWFEDD